MKSWYTLKNTAPGTLALDLTGEISSYWGFSAKTLLSELKAAGDIGTLDLNIYSGGGEVLEGLAIYAMLRNHPARKVVTIQGLAASMASVIAMCGDEIRMSDGSYMMIHNVSGDAYGGSSDLRQRADFMDKLASGIRDIYASRTGLADSVLKTMMEAETWMTGTEALKLGFCTSVLTGKPSLTALANHHRLGTFAHVPPAITALCELTPPKNEPEKKPKSAPMTIEEITALKDAAETELATARPQLTALGAENAAFVLLVNSQASTIKALAADKVELETKVSVLEATHKTASDRAREIAAAHGAVIPDPVNPGSITNGTVPRTPANAATALIAELETETDPEKRFLIGEKLIALR